MYLYFEMLIFTCILYLINIGHIDPCCFKAVPCSWFHSLSVIHHKRALNQCT